MLYFNVPQVIDTTVGIDLSEVSSVSVCKNSHGVWLILLQDGQYFGTPYINTYSAATQALADLKAYGFSDAYETLKSELKMVNLTPYKWNPGKWLLK